LNEPAYNPFAAPTEYDTPAESAVRFEPLPCPSCGSEDAIPAPYSAWYGRRAPKAIQDVICEKCGANFNGESGAAYPPRKSPLFWFIVAVGLFALYVLLIVGTA